MITLLALSIALVMCVGGGTAAWLLLRNADGPGAVTPRAAVTDFLSAVYREGDVAKASQLVCGESRKRADLEKKIDQVRKYRAENGNPQITWDEPKILDQQAERAQVRVTILVVTDDERVATESLNILVVKKTGWLVCEVQTVPAGP